MEYWNGGGENDGKTLHSNVKISEIRPSVFFL
jgi:hypothetical protein